MNKSTRIVKKLLALFLVVLMSIESFAALVGDNDGAAFITKAEFESLKNDFQSQINRYNSSLDNKIDGAIAAYLAGVTVAAQVDVQSIIDKKYVWLEEIGDASALGWRRPNTSITMRSYTNVYFWKANLGTGSSSIDMYRQGTIFSGWYPKVTEPDKMEIYTFDKVSTPNPGYIINPHKDKRFMSGNILTVLQFGNGSGARFMTSNWGNATYAFNSIQYNKLKSENSNVYDVFRTVDWQQGVLWGQSYNVVPFDYVSTAGSPSSDQSYHIALVDNEDSREVWSVPATNGNIVNFTIPTGQISNYMMGGSGPTQQHHLKWNIDDDNTSLLGLIGEGKDRTLQFFDEDTNNILATHARTVKSISKDSLKYNVQGYMYMYRIKPPYYDYWTNDNTLTMDADNSYTTKDLVLTDGLKPWYEDSEDKWPNTLPYDFLIPSIWFNKTLDKSELSYYNKDIINTSISTKLSDYLKNYSWNRGFPMWILDKSGTLAFEPIFKDTTKNYLMWVLKGPSDSNIPYTTAPSNYYKKNSKCTLTQISSGNGKGAIKCKSGDKIIVDDIEKGDIVYLYFTTEDGKAGPILKNGIKATLEVE